MSDVSDVVVTASVPEPTEAIVPRTIPPMPRPATLVPPAVDAPVAVWSVPFDDEQAVRAATRASTPTEADARRRRGRRDARETVVVRSVAVRSVAALIAGRLEPADVVVMMPGPGCGGRMFEMWERP
ncbi:hypothetical protein DEI92_05640 [Curtobacterium sp. MCBD17_034]|nr:hypothetical protein DEI92_05640 [Curtobacterium sp. MCBD17_034]PZM40434.1 hypothetical protein DEI90_01875 [Curtobacterium sp. MCBD17_031]